jgi:hypothetical protein
MYQDHVARDEREGKRIETGTNCKIDDQGISATHQATYVARTGKSGTPDSKDVKNILLCK